MLFTFLKVRRAIRDGYRFTKIYFGEGHISGRCTFGNTKQDVIDYYQEDDLITFKRAWMCIHKDHPTIKSFGHTRLEAHTKLVSVIAYVRDLGYYLGRA